MGGATSAYVLGALLAAGVELCGVVQAAGRFARATQPEPIVALAPPLLALHGPGGASIAQIAWGRGIPVFELRRADDPATLRTIAELRPDVACVACFPLRFSAALLATPPHGCLNMHPSLLPRHRGPAPLFWAFRAGEGQAGVSIHRMDAGFDTGPIALQSPFELPDGVGGDAAEAACARLGAALMLRALRALAAGTLATWHQPPGGSYAPWPAANDWRIDTGWPARRAFNFMRGTAEWGRAYPLRAGGRELVLEQALGFEPAAELGAPFREQHGELLIQFAPGVLRTLLQNARIDYRE